MGELAISSVTESELRHGADYGEIRRHLELAGTPIGAMDLIIAAHARAEGLVLVTHMRQKGPSKLFKGYFGLIT